MKEANSALREVIEEMPYELLQEDVANTYKTFDVSEIAKMVVDKKDVVEKKDLDSDSGFISALDLYNREIKEIPTLLNPFLQKVGLASLVGTSDSGKSTFLRQLSISIALGMKSFMGFQLNCKTNKVLYVSTEDDPYAVSFSIGKQLDYLKQEHKDIDINLIDNLVFFFEFESDKLLVELRKKLKKHPVDLIVIDAFTDVFSKELNANTQVRQFLNEYDKLAKANNCLILFLHHTGKHTQYSAPNKDSIIGSQAFEAKMRVVLELKPTKKNPKRKDLWVLKGNFLDNKHKTKSHVLEINDNLIFSATGDRTDKLQNSKSSDTELIKKVLELHKQEKTYRAISDELKGEGIIISKSSIGTIIKNQKTF